MAITFNKLKSPLLAPTDQISIGKFKGCRVCDVIEDNYEYLIWAEKQGFLKYSSETVEIIQEVAHFAKQKQHYTEEVEPYLEDSPFGEEIREIDAKLLFLSDDDVPF
jgi:uncharacterized protein (DUF3820 family)